jgi:hypothetical protein
MLDESLKNLINFIYDMKLIKQSVVSIGYDADKLPLGELDKETGPNLGIYSTFQASFTLTSLIASKRRSYQI